MHVIQCQNSVAVNLWCQLVLWFQWLWVIIFILHLKYICTTSCCMQLVVPQNFTACTTVRTSVSNMSYLPGLRAPCGYDVHKDLTAYQKLYNWLGGWISFYTRSTSRFVRYYLCLKWVWTLVRAVCLLIDINDLCLIVWTITGSFYLELQGIGFWGRLPNFQNFFSLALLHFMMLWMTSFPQTMTVLICVLVTQ